MESDPLASLADAAREGDATATRQLLGQLAPQMLKVVRMVLGRTDPDVEDVLQDSLVGFVSALATFRQESTVLHFARTVALRRALDHRRSRARRGTHVEIESETLFDPNATPAASVIAERRRQAFRTMIETLRPEQAEAFAHRVLFGYSIDEIAVHTGAPPETVRSRLRLAKAAIRERIQKDPTLLELSETADDDLP